MCPDLLRVRVGGPCTERVLTQEGLYTGEITPALFQLARRLLLPHRLLQPQPEQLPFVQLQLQAVEYSLIQIYQLVVIHLKLIHNIYHQM